MNMKFRMQNCAQAPLEITQRGICSTVSKRLEEKPDFKGYLKDEQVGVYVGGDSRK